MNVRLREISERLRRLTTELESEDVGDERAAQLAAEAADLAAEAADLAAEAVEEANREARQQASAE